MTRRKIFIGVELPVDLKKRLRQKIEQWKDLPIRWSREENLHLTLAFLGFVDDEIIFDVCEKVKKAVKDMEIFDIDLQKIELGPTADKNARVVWFTGKADERLKRLVENIEKSLGIFNKRKKTFKPHITLGRIRKYGWRKLQKTPNLAEDFSVLLTIDKAQVIESAVVDGKRNFSVIESCPLKD